LIKFILPLFSNQFELKNSHFRNKNNTAILAKRQKLKARKSVKNIRLL